jgi:hypothetical protein
MSSSVAPSPVPSKPATRAADSLAAAAILTVAAAVLRLALALALGRGDALPSVLVSALQVPLVYLGARRALDPRVAFGGAALLALHPLAIDLAVRAPRDNLVGLALAASLALVTSASPLRCLAAGLVLGAAAPLQLAAPLVGLLLAVPLVRARRGAAAVLALAVLAAAAISLRLGGDGESGARVALTHCPIYRIEDGARELVHATADQRRTRRGETPLPSQHATVPLTDGGPFVRQAVGCMAAAPRAALRRWLLNASDLFAGAPWSAIGSWPDNLRLVDRVALGTNFALAYLVVPLALVGAWHLRRRGAFTWVLAAPLGLLLASLLQPSQPLARVPFDFVFLLGAVAAAVHWWDAPPRLPASGDGAHPFSERFWLGEIDLRPLAITRICMGAIATVSTLDYGPSLFDFFGAGGLFPSTNDPSVWTPLAAWLDSRPFLVAVWGAGVFGCAAFALGWWTRAANLVAWAALSILQTRSIWPCDGSDMVLRVSLMWFLFTPAGARFSLDARWRGRVRARAPAFPIRFLQIQLVWIYLSSFLSKIVVDVWRNGTAVHYALADSFYSRPWGSRLADVRWLITLATFFTLAVEGGFLLLVLFPVGQPRLRRLALAGGAALHIGINVLMKPGFFSYVMLSLYPVWMDLPAPSKPSQGEAPLPGRARRGARLLGRAALAVGFVVAIWGSTSERFSLPCPDWVIERLRDAGQVQEWAMFQLSGPRLEQRLVTVGWLSDGSVVESVHGDGRGALLARGQAASYSRWIKMEHLLTYGTPENVETLARIVCRRWNRGAGDAPRLVRVVLFRRERLMAPIGRAAAPWADKRLLEHTCSAALEGD